MFGKASNLQLTINGFNDADSDTNDDDDSTHGNKGRHIVLLSLKKLLYNVMEYIFNLQFILESKHIILFRTKQSKLKRINILKRSNKC